MGFAGALTQGTILRTSLYTARLLIGTFFVYQVTFQSVVGAFLRVEKIVLPKNSQSGCNGGMAQGHITH
jgi:hypothetical protein